MPEKKTVDAWLNDVNYSVDAAYTPTVFSLMFVNFIKLLHDGDNTENKTPVVHYRMLDKIVGKKENIANLCHRGLAKTTLFAEYLFLYIAVFGEIPGFGQIDYALYVSDSIENGIKKMRLRLERHCENSKFLAKYLSKYKITDNRWYFKNINGKEFVVTGHGAKTGVRGTVELNTRPQLAILDDLISDDDARSPTIIDSVENTIYKAIDYALHPSKRKIIWSGTPFNSKDPLYKAIESGGWYANVFPVCEKFPCTREEFKGSWEDRFTYDYVKGQYDKAVSNKHPEAFFQELMLRITSEEEKLIKKGDIIWYDLATLLQHKTAYNYYITTDFATSDKQSADYSVISVWGLSNNGEWFYVDGICVQALMNVVVDELFRLVQLWNPLEVGVETTGQQGGFVAWIQKEMISRNILFTLSTGKNSSTIGIRPTKDKMSRFSMNAIPLFKNKKIWLPESLKESKALIEAQEELSLATHKGFKSKHDDWIDTVSMLSELNSWKPSELGSMQDISSKDSYNSSDDLWDMRKSDDYYNSSYIV